VPSETSYGAFSGGIGVVAALIGTVALFIDSLDGIVTWVLDGVSALALLAAGVVSLIYWKLSYLAITTSRNNI
jgi:hypothetical protein